MAFRPPYRVSNSRLESAKDLKIPDSVPLGDHMGLRLFTASSSRVPDACLATIQPPPKLPNPDPSHYRILRYKEYVGALVIEIEYPDCTNYEGRKILLFKDIKLNDLLKQKLIDPHFCDRSKYHHPFARFAPTEDGWQAALGFVAKVMNRW